MAVFESAIDALSYLTLQKMSGKDWRAISCLSLAGVYRAKEGETIRLPAALEQYLKDHSEITEILLCLDHDAVGMSVSERIYEALNSQYQVKQVPPAQGKDYNEWLQIKKRIAGGVKTRGERVY